MTFCGDFGHCSKNVLPEKNNFGLIHAPLSCLVSEVQKTPSSGLEPRTIFSGLCALFLSSRRRNEQFSSKLCSSVFLSFQATDDIIVKTNSGQFWVHNLRSCNLIVQFLSYVYSSVLLSPRGTGNIVTGTRTQDSF
jgi:hypothetical protein